MGWEARLATLLTPYCALERPGKQGRVLWGPLGFVRPETMGHKYGLPLSLHSGIFCKPTHQNPLITSLALLSSTYGGLIVQARH